MSILHERASADKVYRVKGTQKVAWTKHGLTAYRKLGSSREILYRPEPSIAFRENELADMKRESIHELVVDDHNGNRYRVTLDKYFANCSPINFGHGRQLRLPLRMWEVECARPQHSNAVCMIKERQLSLFDEVPS